MSQFITHKIRLSPGQKSSVLKSVKEEKPIVLRLKKDQLDGEDEVLLLPSHMKQITKAKNKGSGVVLKLSPTFVDQAIKRGGFFPKLIGALYAPVLKDFMDDMKHKRYTKPRGNGIGNGLSFSDFEMFLDILKEVITYSRKKGDGIHIPKSTRRMMDMAAPGVGTLFNFVMGKIKGGGDFLEKSQAKSIGCCEYCKGSGLFVPGTIRPGGDGLFVPGGSIATAKPGDIGVYTGEKWVPASVGVYSGDGVFQDLDDYLKKTSANVKTVVKEKVIPKVDKLRKQSQKQFEQTKENIHENMPEFITKLVEKKKS